MKVTDESIQKTINESIYYRMIEIYDSLKYLDNEVYDETDIHELIEIIISRLNILYKMDRSLFPDEYIKGSYGTCIDFSYDISVSECIDKINEILKHLKMNKIIRCDMEYGYKYRIVKNNIELTNVNVYVNNSGNSRIEFKYDDTTGYALEIFLQFLNDNLGKSYNIIQLPSLYIELSVLMTICIRGAVGTNIEYSTIHTSDINYELRYRDVPYKIVFNNEYITNKKSWMLVRDETVYENDDENDD